MSFYRKITALLFALILCGCGGNNESNADKNASATTKFNIAELRHSTAHRKKFSDPVRGSFGLYGIAFDSRGNLYLPGYSNIGMNHRDAFGFWDSILVKYDQQLTRIWVAESGVSNGDSEAYGVAVDSNDNIYVVGLTDVDLVANHGHAKGLYDYFLAKYNTNGILQWIVEVGESNARVQGFGVATDNGGNIYITGLTDVGLNGQNEVGTEFQSQNYFIAKYDTNGGLVWSKQGGNSYESGISQGYAVTIDKNNDNAVYVAGLTDDESSSNYFLASYTTESGGLNWIKTQGGIYGRTEGYALTTGNNGNIYLAGLTQNAISPLSHRKNVEAGFIVSYSKSGDLIWANEYGYGDNPEAERYREELYGITMSNDGMLYATGFSNLLYFDPSTWPFSFGKISTILLQVSESGVGGVYFEVGPQDYHAYGYAVNYNPSNSQLYFSGYADQFIFDIGRPQAPDFSYFIVEQQPGSTDVESFTQYDNSGASIVMKTATIDHNGNFYTQGFTDAQIGIESQQSTSDYFIAKGLQDSGSVSWTHQSNNNTLNTYGLQIPTSILVESGSHTVFTSGYYRGIESAIMPYVGYYISKLNESGELQWVKTFHDNNPAPTVNHVGYAMTMRNDNQHLYVVGSYNDDQVAIYHHSESGALLDTKVIGNGDIIHNRVKAEEISFDLNNNYYVVGDTNIGLLDQPQLGTNSINYFVFKYDSNDNLVWAKQFGMDNAQYTPTSVMVSANGDNLYVAGTLMLYTDGSVYYFIAKFDSSGNLIWINQSNQIYVFCDKVGLALDSMGNSYLSGEELYDIAGDGHAFNSPHVFYSKHNTDGQQEWLRILLEDNDSADMRDAGSYIDSHDQLYLFGNTNTLVSGVSGAVQKGLIDYYAIKFDGSSDYTDPIWETQVGVAALHPRIKLTHSHKAGNL
jgi:hypothetical protein